MSHSNHYRLFTFKTAVGYYTLCGKPALDVNLWARETIDAHSQAALKQNLSSEDRSRPAPAGECSDQQELRAFRRSLMNDSLRAPVALPV